MCAVGHFSREIQLDKAFLGLKGGSRLDCAIRQIAVVLCSNDTQQLEWWKHGKPPSLHPMCFDTFQVDVLVDREEPFDDFEGGIASIASNTSNTSNTSIASNPGILSDHEIGKHKLEIAHWLEDLHVIEAKQFVVMKITQFWKVDVLEPHTRHRHLNLIKRYKRLHPFCSGNFYFATYKVNAADLDPHKLHEALTNESYLETKYMTICDADVKQDFACCVTPHVLQHLQSIGLQKRSLREQDKIKQEELGPNELFIYDNSSRVGNNCPSVIGTVHNIWVRAKFYNKFVMMIESPSVRGWIGSHIHHWTDGGGAGKLLSEAILDPRTQENGLSRIEFTLLKGIPKDFRDLENVMEKLRSLFLPHANATPIREQWKVLGSCLQETSYIYDTHTGVLHSIRWINRLTRKANGFEVKTKKQSSKQIDEILRTSSFFGLDIKLWLLDYQLFVNGQMVKDYHGREQALGEQALSKAKVDRGDGAHKEGNSKPLQTLLGDIQARGNLSTHCHCRFG